MADEIKVYPIDGGFVFSVGGTWMPGVYATERAAKLASGFGVKLLTSAWEHYGPEPITEAILEAGDPPRDQWPVRARMFLGGKALSDDELRRLTE